MDKNKAVKKVEIAIDKMVDLQDAGYGCPLITEILGQLNFLSAKISVERAAGRNC